MIPDRQRLLERLVREISRCEAQAIEHAMRIEKLIGFVAPVFALRDVSRHAAAMRVRFDSIVSAYELQPAPSRFNATLSTLRGLVAERVTEPERAYRTCLLDLRHGVDVVKLSREVSRTEELFGLIRWCDDWLGARRTLVARVEAQLPWFLEEEPAVSDYEVIVEPAEADGTTIALPVFRHEQDDGIARTSTGDAANVNQTP
jgi:hypothetical protein